MLKPNRFLLATLCLLPSLALAETDQAPGGESRFLRFPTVSDSQIVFSYDDQLYTVGLEGGTARRLTDTPGYAVFPHFSPDGKSIAFTGQYDGNTEVYVMDASGSAPKRLTYTATLGRDDLSDRMGPNNLVLGWTHDGKVAFRSRMKSFNDFQGQLFTVGLDADLPKQLPVPMGGFLSFSPDDSKMAYNRVFREFRTWKTYRGGMADDIWVFDFKTGQIEDITNNPGQDIEPMWAPNGKVYFLSDRDGRANLYSYDLSSKQTAQYTHFTDFDCKFASLGGHGIVFENAGAVWYFDLKTEKSHQVPITVREDEASVRPARMNVAKYVEGGDVSPDGKRLVVSARGHLFSVPAKDGPTRELTKANGVHERDPIWSPDGKSIAYISDESGENELYVRSQDGTGTPVQLTHSADTYYFTPVWSPDSKKILYSDRKQRLRYVDVASKAVTLVDTATAFTINDYSWSPDSLWIVYTKPEDASEPKIWLYSVSTEQRTEVTDGSYEGSSPIFSDDGKYLAFASGRDYRPLNSDVEFNNVFVDIERVYLITLSKKTKSPFEPKDDEVEIKADDKKDSADKKPDDKKDAKPEEKKEDKKIDVDTDGIKERIVALPIQPSNYSLVRVVGTKVYYNRLDSVEAAGGKGDSTLAVYDLKERKETEIGTGSAFTITPDGKKLLVRQGKDFVIVDTPSAKADFKDKVSLGNLTMVVDRKAEFAQIYNESWRQMRDFFFSPTMNGVDWKSQGEKYSKLLPYAQTRYDLTYLIGELIGELHSGHSYVGGGDRPMAAKVKTGLLGAELSRDAKSGAYRIDRILPGLNWTDDARSPLSEPGVEAKNGDYIVAVDGVPTQSMPNIYASLVGKAGVPVTLKINAAPTLEGAHEVTVEPIGDESKLYYYAWVQHNTDYVAQKTGGQVGYIYLPDMGPEGMSEFTRQFYPQIRRKGLIIDDRGNGGGNVSPIITEHLRRQMVMVQQGRNQTPVPNPNDVQVGPKVLLTNEYSASDGDIFPYRFKFYHMGTVIGKRTWGGVVGIRGTLPFIDGGFLNRPEFGPYTSDGKGWPIEGHGVDPDIVVDNDPSKEFAGVDQQLDRGIEEILAQLKAHDPSLPPTPPYPDRSHPERQ